MKFRLKKSLLILLIKIIKLVYYFQLKLGGIQLHEKLILLCRQRESIRFTVQQLRLDHIYLMFEVQCYICNLSKSFHIVTGIMFKMETYALEAIISYCEDDVQNVYFLEFFLKRSVLLLEYIFSPCVLLSSQTTF